MSDEWGPWVDGEIEMVIGGYVQCIAIEDAGELPDVIHEGIYLGMTPDGYAKMSPPFPDSVYEWTIDRWRERKPRGLTVLQELIANLPAPVRESEDA